MNIRQGPPRPAPLPNHYRNPSATYQGPLWCVIGTAHGYIHRADGGIRTWKSRSGAYRAAKRHADD